MLHNFLQGTCLACVDDHRHKPQSCTYVSKHGRKLESRLLIASGADSAECALMHSFMLVSEISCFGGKKWSTGLVCGLGFYQFQSKLVLRSVAKGFGQCVRFRVRLQILNNSFSGAPQSDIYQCACPQAGRQMWRMTSCSEICGSENAEQAQPSGNCQQYGVRSYLHQVLDMHTHRDNRRTSTDQPVTNVNSSVQSHTSWSWELISDCLTRILHLNLHLNLKRVDFHTWYWNSLCLHPSVLWGVHSFDLGTWRRFSDSEIAEQVELYTLEGEANLCPHHTCYYSKQWPAVLL